MADQTRKPKPKKEEEAAQSAESTSTEEKDEELDDLLDEIDEVLEVNAEDFVRGFVQKGGELVLPAGLIFNHEVPLIAAALIVLGIYLIWMRQRII